MTGIIKFQEFNVSSDCYLTPVSYTSCTYSLLFPLSVETPTRSNLRTWDHIFTLVISSKKLHGLVHPMICLGNVYRTLLHFKSWDHLKKLFSHRNFAKRQMTWFRNEHIYQWLNASRPLVWQLVFIDFGGFTSRCIDSYNASHIC